MAASSGGHVAVIRALIEAHADVKQHSWNGKRAIDLARDGDHKEVGEILLQSETQV